MRVLFKTLYWLFAAALIAAAALGSIVLRRSHQMETTIASAAARRGIDPRLFAALVEECSGGRTTFADHERYGLLALSAEDARIWAEQNGVEPDTFTLFDPKQNLRIGAWKLDQALATWSRERDPRIWALAGWKTNRETVRVWAAAARGATGDPVRAISDSHARNFVRDILGKTRREEFTLVLPWGRKR